MVEGEWRCVLVTCVCVCVCVSLRWWEIIVFGVVRLWVCGGGEWVCLYGKTLRWRIVV